MKRILALALALVMLCSIGIVAHAADELVDGKFAETRHITVRLFQRGDNIPEESPWADYIRKGMLEKYNVEVEFTVGGRWDDEKDLAAWLSSEQAPDVCYTYSYSTILNYADMGGMIDLAPYIDQYKDLLPNLFNLLGEDNVYWDKDPEKGTLWALETRLVNNARINTFIRKDWLDKLNLTMPTNKAEFEERLIAFRDNAELLLGEDAAKMVPYSTSYDIGWRNNNLTVSFVPDDITDEELYIRGYDDRQQFLPGAKEAMRLLNKWYNEKLVWQDFALYGSGDTTEDDNLKAGFVGSFQHNYDYPFRNGEDSIDQNLKRNVGPEAEFVAVDCFENDAGLHRKYLGSTVDRKVCFPATNDEVLASLLYLDFISDPETIKFLQVGPEGITHDRDENGAYVKKTLDSADPYYQASLNNIDFTMTCNGLYLGEYTDASFGYSLAPVDPALVADAYAIAMNDGRVPAHYIMPAIEAEVGIGTTLNDERNSFLGRAVTASVEDFDRIYDEGVANYMSIGGQAIMEERAEKIEAETGYKFAE
ncbi:MAG: sugar ABC transporter substrate-binding protein [Clostridia bacterium]|nr:sugar ABC transporter substrate-binding protein [Clostridia bacterium]